MAVSILTSDFGEVTRFGFGKEAEICCAVTVRRLAATHYCQWHSGCKADVRHQAYMRRLSR